MIQPRTFTVDLCDDPARLLRIANARPVDALGANIGFTDPRWLSLWYESFTRHTEIEALIAVVNDAGVPASADDLDRVAMAIPLIRRKKYGLPVIEFADRGVTDYNLPVVGPRLPVERADRDAAFQALLNSLRPFAALRLHKMPLDVDGRPNPLGRAVRASISDLGGHTLDVEGSPQAFEDRLSRKKRKELRREWRNLEALGGFDFALANEPGERETVFDMIKASQRMRVPAKGHPYILEDPGYGEFYDRLVLDGAFAGFSMLFALWLDGAPVAGLLAVQRGDRLTCLRIGQTDDAALRRFGPGRQLVYRTGLWAAQQGLKTFDLSLGQSDLKAWFGCETLPLVDADMLLGGVMPFGRRVA